MYAPSPQQVHIRIWRNCDIIAWGGGSPLITLENIRTDDDDVEDKFKMPSKFCIFGVKRRVRNVNKNRKNKSSLQRISHNSRRTSK